MALFNTFVKENIKAKKRYIYFMTDRNRSSIVVGTSDNLINTINKFRSIPNLHFDVNDHYSRLVYFEQFDNETLLQKRFADLQHTTKTQKEKIIRSVNADWIDLSLAVDFESIMDQNYSYTRSDYRMISAQ
ncbi:GIY-YIG nuclease family protein [Solitalea sp. MAHUQ-68]|uniref:GIY-YIG nuclease family protein n=1 Tax=Solitalea agri TaxID=2953739 RepID=A0A9X2JCB8_9SPHI|nr:GIY-YIG nuclease family protein [Solitalea agri]MCO4291625.1 GIY-YIG nuclease family protein [Solitalea agri]